MKQLVLRMQSLCLKCFMGVRAISRMATSSETCSDLNMFLESISLSLVSSERSPTHAFQGQSLIRMKAQ